MKYAKVMVSAFLIGLTGAFMPGPMLVAVVALAPQRFMNVVYILAGHAAVEVSIVVLFWLGLARLIRRGGGRGFLVMKWVGGAALVALGALMLKDAAQVSLAARSEGGAAVVHPFLLGAVVSVSNPYFLFWWATVGLGLASQSIRVGRLGPPLFFVGHIHADIVWYLLVGTAVYLGRSLLSEAIYRWVVIVGGAFLVLFGLYFALIARWHPAERAPETAT